MLKLEVSFFSLLQPIYPACFGWPPGSCSPEFAIVSNRAFVQF